MKIIEGIVSCKDCPTRYKGCRVFESCSLDQLEHLEKTNTILPNCPLPDSPVEISRDETNRWQDLADDIKKWSDSTFGMYRLPKAMVNHLKKEVEELSQALEVYYGGNYSQEIYFKNLAKVKEEFADCIMLLLDAVSHFEGMTIPKLMDETTKKLEVNKGRKWGKEDENGVIEHIENNPVLKSNPNDLNTGWIPVSEILPGKSQFDMSDDVLTLAGKKMSVKCYDYELARWSGSPHVTITHWCPLPEPPKTMDLVYENIQEKGCRTCKFLGMDGKYPCDVCGDGNYIKWQPIY
jgi:NTP pyrophosphatase (non-canonical NTP hydrolase)